MKKILLSIHPEFVERIFKGEKRFEYRKKIYAKEVSDILIYSTSPKKKVVGEFKVAKIRKGTPSVIWESTSNYSGISKQDFFDYFKETDIAYAIEIESYIKYNTPLALSDFGFSYPPQFFYYLKEKDSNL